MTSHKTTDVDKGNLASVSRFTDGRVILSFMGIPMDCSVHLTSEQAETLGRMLLGHEE